jgi:hypothetical protein
MRCGGQRVKWDEPGIPTRIEPSEHSPTAKRINVPVPPPRKAVGVMGEAFLQGLREVGYVEGQNIAVEWRFAEEKSERYPDLTCARAPLVGAQYVPQITTRMPQG